MKITFTAFVICCLCSITAFSQLETASPVILTKFFKLKKVGTSFGFDSDQITGLGHEQLLSQAKGELSFDPSTLAFEDADLESMICENPNIGVELIFSTPIPNSEFRLGLSAMFNRIEDVTLLQQFHSSRWKLYAEKSEHIFYEQ